MEAQQGGAGSSNNAPAQTTTKVSSVAPSPASTTSGPDARIDMIRSHLERYRALSAQGKWADAGKELEAVESLVKK